MSGALIVTAELAPPDFAWLDALRRRHFPPERNQLPAHLTMFQALPPSSENEIRRELGRHAATSAPRAAIAGLMNFGTGVAFRIVSDDLEAIRADIAEHCHGLLRAQDEGWRPHVTIQNKVQPSAARKLLVEMEEDFRPRLLGISALALHRYLGGPWGPLARYPFRGI
jgi:2'-5' RNA ligase